MSKDNWIHDDELEPLRADARRYRAIKAAVTDDGVLLLETRDQEAAVRLSHWEDFSGSDGSANRAFIFTADDLDAATDALAVDQARAAEGGE